MIHEPIKDTQAAYESIVAWFSRPDAQYGYDEDNNRCVYRADLDATSPIRCAMGCLIPNDLYHAEFEGESVIELFYDKDHDGTIRKYFKYVSEDFLSEVQMCHDDANSVEKFLIRLPQLAAEFGLTEPK